MQLRILGCSGGIGGERRTTSMLVDDDLLIDCGTGVGELSLDEMARLRHVFLSHTHLDHIAGLPLLVDTLFNHLIERPLIIHAQPESMEIIQQHIFNWQIWPDFFELPAHSKPSVVFEAMRPGETVEIDGRRIEMIPVNHTVPTVGYRVQGSGGSFAFSGDTTRNETLWAALNAHDGLDLLVVECGFSDEEREIAELAKHYSPELLAADLQQLRHDPEILITHLKPGDEERIFAELEAAVSGRRLRRLTGGDRFQL
ncbi:MAG: 3',5'-cyclic-nucleotide phosphodiesterase [Gammaproteobacteria bacterium]|nr:MAG: 3',5'-cyclic-nucleotide phosphodiesterase [Gammaproteobacteria bacterium]